ncbi:single-stranded DNA-binding protein [compost metagenome]
MNGSMQLLGGRGGSSDDAPRQPRPQREPQQQAPRAQAQPQQRPAAQQPAPDYDSFDDDIPF